MLDLDRHLARVISHAPLSANCSSVEHSRDGSTLVLTVSVENLMIGDQLARPNVPVGRPLLDILRSVAPLNSPVLASGSSAHS